MHTVTLKPLLAVAVLLLSAPLYAEPGHGNPGHGNPGHGNHGKDKHHDKGRRAEGGDIHINMGYSDARRLAVSHGLTGYTDLPPGIAKNIARGKPLPPGIAKKAVPEPMLRELPHYPGYEWRIAGRDLVLIALSTAVVTSVINNVFD
ncbi:anti-virulence regulator CigR family protein [Mixta sp. Marseille-Q2659]|uniref:anti-virulence regulator CigR family protein n=1 Tax=Mixta sp. Marseille-Q2659 TaxID=2736607 RepID=UPI0023B97CB1|nr:anti-virulence regulator CigR family protein [Mixta sp. Marseille-Q2659]